MLPFVNMSGNPEHEFFADGLTEDIITALARLNWLFVIARNSTFVYRNKPTDVRDVARDLGVRYVLEGSVRVADRRIRITGQLIEAETGKHVWAERYDRVLEDLFAVQDEIAEHVVGAVEPHLYAEEGYRAARHQPGRIDAWGLAVRALNLINKIERRQNEEAQRDAGRGDRRGARPMRARTRCSVGPNGGRRCATGSTRGARATGRPPRTRKTRWRSMRPSRGRAWSQASASRPTDSTTVRSASCASR